MKLFSKTLLAGALSCYFAIAGSVIADNEVKHKFIQIHADNKEDVVIKIEKDDVLSKFVITHEELADEDLLDIKLAELDDETRETVMQALEGTRHMFDGSMDLGKMKLSGFDGDHKVMVINGGEGHVLFEDGFDGIDLDVHVEGDGDHKIIKKHVIVADGKHGVLKGHTNAIVKMIERGEFSQDELDQIQAALDQKR